MKVRLGDYVSIKTGRLDANAASENGKFPFFTCSVEPLKIDKYSYDCECVLVAGNGDLNVKYYYGKFDAYQRTYIIESRNKNILSVKYLYFLLDNYLDTLRKEAIGGVIKYIKLSNLSEAKIKLLDLEKQLEIVNILEKINLLISLRKNQLKKLDELVKCRFIEMFGTFPENSKNWTICTIKEIVSDVRYGTSRASVDGGKYPYLRMNNITYDGELDLTDLKYIDIPDKELEKCTVKCGDVLFNRTNSKELVGKTCVYNRNDTMVLAGFIIRIRVNENILPVFLAMFLNMDFSKTMLKEMCKSAIGQANINATELQKIRIILPPIELQEEFVEFKNQTDKSKLEIEKSLDKLEILKKSLIQKYFG